MNYEIICQKAKEITIETGSFIRSERSKFTSDKIEHKGTHEYVSYVDKQSEIMLVEKLHKLVPESGFIAEEGTSTLKGDVYNWIIDPLDGTTNFIHGVPPYSISVALIENEEIVVGVVYEVFSGECFYAYKGGKAYLDGKEIRVSQTPTINDSLIATGFPYRDYARLDQFMESLVHFMKHSHGLRRHGSAAVDMAYVACGRFDAFYEYGLCPWDAAAGIIIIQQAGGKLCDFDGGNNYLHGREIVASNALVFDELSEKISELMK